MGLLGKRESRHRGHQDADCASVGKPGDLVTSKIPIESSWVLEKADANCSRKGFAWSKSPGTYSL